MYCGVFNKGRNNFFKKKQKERDRDKVHCSKFLHYVWKSTILFEGRMS